MEIDGTQGQGSAYGRSAAAIVLKDPPPFCTREKNIQGRDSLVMTETTAMVPKG